MPPPNVRNIIIVGRLEQSSHWSAYLVGYYVERGCRSNSNWYRYKHVLFFCRNSNENFVKTNGLFWESSAWHGEFRRFTGNSIIVSRVLIISLTIQNHHSLLEEEKWTVQGVCTSYRRKSRFNGIESQIGIKRTYVVARLNRV